MLLKLYHNHYNVHKCLNGENSNRKMKCFILNIRAHNHIFITIRKTGNKKSSSFVVTGGTFTTIYGTTSNGKIIKMTMFFL